MYIREVPFIESSEQTQQDYDYAREITDNYMYVNHAGAALETEEELKQEREGLVDAFLYFMRYHDLHPKVTIKKVLAKIEIVYEVPSVAPHDISDIEERVDELLDAHLITLEADLKHRAWSTVEVKRV